jgi:hypothetical protein
MQCNRARLFLGISTSASTARKSIEKDGCRIKNVAIDAKRWPEVTTFVEYMSMVTSVSIEELLHSRVRKCSDMRVVLWATLRERGMSNSDMARAFGMNESSISLALIRNKDIVMSDENYRDYIARFREFFRSYDKRKSRESCADDVGDVVVGNDVEELVDFLSRVLRKAFPELNANIIINKKNNDD